MSPLAKKITRMIALQEAASEFDPYSDYRLDFFRAIGEWIIDAGFVDEDDMSGRQFQRLLEFLMPAIGRFEYEVRKDTLERIDSPDLLVFRATREAFAHALTGTRGFYDPADADE